MTAPAPATPSGYADLCSDADDAPPLGPVRDLHVDQVGVVRARKPMPRSAAVLTAAVQPQFPAHVPRRDRDRLRDQMAGEAAERFLRDHLADGEYERLIDAMIDGQAPADTLTRVLEGIATWGTGRPTSPSSRCA
ncbi:hypothetical protein [Microbacterium sp.]|uniref:hypothetical protein n=1 Tax=Microbacterium sp. TaxID=51671 RepID=UPI00257C0ED8|nr:hypothetical protein [Microbacterium sp.]|tara:strand:- start:10309 stop:10713 length:405 start_codon:yes stop_codon:yes gene_type:complete